MTSTYFMIFLFGIVLVWNEVQLSNSQPLGMEDYYNLIEPKDNVIDVWNKPKNGKVNMKNLILSMQKLEAKQKQLWNRNEEKTEKIMKSTEIMPIEAVTTTASIESTTASFKTTEHYAKAPKLTSLHEQMESDQKRFFHSAVDGWIF